MRRSKTHFAFAIAVSVRRVGLIVWLPFLIKSCFSVAITVLSVACADAKPSLPAAPTAAAFLNVANLPQFRPIARSGFFSSYDRTGGNDDGFSGRYSVLRKEKEGLVIAEVEGPGAITRIFTPTPTNDPIDFYFDGEKTPRISYGMRQLFTDENSPLAGPLTGFGLGGYFSYVPLEFEKSINVVVRGPNVRFYHINYVLYEVGVPVHSYSPGARFHLVAETYDGEHIVGDHSLRPGGSVTIFSAQKPGRIQSIRLSPADAFAGRERDILLRMTWDNAPIPAVEVPVGDFFGYSFGKVAMKSLLLGTSEGEDYVDFPMPYSQAARIELVSQREEGIPLNIQSVIIVSDRGKTDNEGYFHAVWHRENPTHDGQPFTYLDVTGRGQMVGAILQAQGFEPGDTSFFEGDDETTIDGQMAFHGTGSEDSFNGGWYFVPGRWNQHWTLPLSGCLEFQRHLARTGGYRLLIGDAYSFNRSLRYTIEHAPERNDIPTDYVGTTFFYLDRAAGVQAALPAKELRAVVDPESFRLVFSPSPPPIASLVGASAAPSARQVGDHWFQFLAFTRDTSSLPPKHDEGALGRPNPDGNHFDTWWGPPSVAFDIEVAESGIYAISVDGLMGPQAAQLQMRIRDEPIGEEIDFYAPTIRRSGLKELARIPLEAGRNTLYFTMPSRNPKSTGAQIQLLQIQGVRLR